MKNSLLTLSLVFSCLCSVAQYQLTIKLLNTKGKPLPNVEVTAFNASANDRVVGTTNSAGSVTLTLSKAGVYSLSYLDQINFDTYEVKSGRRGTSSRTVTYDPKGLFVPKPKADRSEIEFKTISPLQFQGKPNIMAVTLRVVTPNKVPIPNTEIILASISGKYKMKATTNAKGEAIFFVATKANFEIDVDGIEAVDVIKTPNKPGLNLTKLVFYEKLLITEIAKGDTLLQKDITQINGTNTHLLFNLKLLNYRDEPLEGEPVYLKAENNTRVFETVTDQNGECKLMLPKSANYILNLKYEQGLHFVDAKNSVGFGSESLTRWYRGSAEIERIIAEQEAEMQRLIEEEKAEKEQRRLMAMAAEERKLEKKKMEKELVLEFYDKKFVPSFNTTPIRTAKQPTEYLKPTSDGYTIDFKSSSLIGTPTIIGDEMFIPAGYYSPNFYCLNASTGEYKWGLQLGESGMSPAVHSNGVILVNTYSCTLYAIDAKTGSLLWSKWLAGTVYSTPTADGDKVYVVFRYGGAYVLSCFDLRSGEFLWINRVDSETIACPVIAGDEVHVASQSGFYYIFNKSTGKPLEVITEIDAVSSPTITDKSIFLTATVDGKDRLVEIDRKTRLSSKYHMRENRIFGVR